MTDWISLAEKHGAKLAIESDSKLAPGKWGASAYMRGRKIPLVTILGDSAEDAAKLYCEYYHIKPPREHA